MGARVTLVDRGQEPRRALRFTFGAAPPVLVVLSIEQSARIEGRPAVTQPRIDVRLALEIEKVTPEGDAMARYRVLSTEASAPPSTGLDETRAALLSIERASVPVIFTARGDVAVTGLLSVDDGGPSAAGILVFDVLRDLDAPLPFEPVGVGARWEVQPDHGDAATFRIDRLDDSGANIHVERRALAPAAAAFLTTNEGALALHFDRVVREAHLVMRARATVSAPNLPSQPVLVERVVTMKSAP